MTALQVLQVLQVLRPPPIRAELRPRRRARQMLLVLRVAVELLQQLRRHSNLRLRRERVPSLHAGVPQAEGRGSLRRGQGAKAEAVQADDHD